MKPDKRAGEFTSIVGFDSAWTDNSKAPGAVCVIRPHSDGAALSVIPHLASFGDALAVIAHEQTLAVKCVVSLDQPTIVPNLTGSRPIDKVAASLVSWIGGGVQPASRSKIGMFDDNAPIWRFKSALSATEDPELARTGSAGTYLLEVFPALALPALEASFCSRLGAPKYNPANRKRFRIVDWQAVVAAVSRSSKLNAVREADEWCARAASHLSPTKADQDKLDALIWALVGLHWLMAPRAASAIIGDLYTGYMIVPAIRGVHERLISAAQLAGVRIN